MLLVAAANTTAAAVAYLTFRRLDVGPRLAFGLAAIWSVGLIAWEYYRIFGNHNSINIAVVTFLVHAATVRFQQPGTRSDLWFAAAGGLTVLTYGPGLILVPALAVLSLPWRAGPYRWALSLALAVSLPAAVYGAAGGKNYANFGVFSTSTYLSLNTAQFGFISLGYENQESQIRTLMPDLKPSPWWTWCFDRERGDGSQSLQVLRAFQGLCIPYDRASAVREALDAARSMGDGRFQRSLERDLEVSETAPWAIRFGSQNMSSATEVEFNEISKRIYGLRLRQAPMAMARTFLLANRSFFIWGPLMFDGVHHEPQAAAAPSLINAVATGLGLLFILAVAASGVALIILAVTLVRRLRHHGVGGAVALLAPRFLSAGLFLTYLLAATIMNAVSCCENARQFQSMSIFPLIAAGIMLRFVSDWIQRHRPNVA